MDATRLAGQKGQNTVEYMMMLAMVVGVALVVGASIKRFMPQLWNQMQNMISSAARGSYDSHSVGP